MATEGECIGVVRVELAGPIEEFDSLFVFFLEGEAVSNCNPCFRDEQGFVKGLVGQVAEFYLLLEMPQAA